MIASDLRRARASARIFGLLWNRDVELDPRVREMDFGHWDGQLWSTIEATDSERFREWADRWTDVAPPGGEPLSAVAARAADWLAEIRASEGAGSTIVVVSHAGWIRVVVTQLLGRPLNRIFDLPVDFGHATVLRVEGRRARVVALNAAGVPLRVEG